MEPRYLTIRIQYYPVDKKLLVLLLVSLFILSLYNFIEPWITFPVVEHVHAAEKFQLEYASHIEQKEKIALSDEYTHAAISQPIKGVISHGSRERNQIALTFDADMTYGMKAELDSGKVVTYYDKQIIQILNESQTKATIFMAGMWIEAYPAITKELVRNPLFELGNHSYSHPSFSGDCYGLGEISNDRNAFEITKTQILLQSIGVQNSYFRFPGGCYSQEDIADVNAEGLSVVHWDVSGYDGFNHDAASIEQNIISHVQNGSIIVLHLGGEPNTPKTAEVLPRIISQLKAKGFEFVKVSELLEGKKENQRNKNLNNLNLPSYISHLSFR